MNQPSNEIRDTTDTSTESAQLDSELIQLLRCPQTGKAVQAAAPSIIAAVNLQIKAGDCRAASGEIVTEPLQGGLLTECGTWLYPIRDAIPTMIAEESIQLGSARNN